MKTILKLILISLLPVAAPAAEPEAPLIKLTAKELQISLSERPRDETSAPERSLHSRAFSFQKSKEVSVSWGIKEGEVHLDATSSFAMRFRLPKDFREEQKKIGSQEWQLGTFTKQGAAYSVVLSVEQMD